MRWATRSATSPTMATSRCVALGAAPEAGGPRAGGWRPPPVPGGGGGGAGGAATEPPFTVDNAYVDVGATSRDEVLALGVGILSPLSLTKRPHLYGDRLLAAPN